MHACLFVYRPLHYFCNVTACPVHTDGHTLTSELHSPAFACAAYKYSSWKYNKQLGMAVKWLSYT